MNFDYDEQQQLLADSVRRYLSDKYPFEQRKKIVAGEGWSPQAWAQFAEMGLMGLPLSTDHGGFGGGAVDLMGVMEAFGEALVVEPYLSQVLAARAIERGGSAKIKEALLPGVADGSVRLAFAHAERGTRYSLDAVRTSARGGKLTGSSSSNARTSRRIARWTSAWRPTCALPMRRASASKAGRCSSPT
jgi:alkylation response protein AidB-like acyl-CoA dehydrogenase